MLVTEPAVTFMACYASFVYGMLYLFLEVFPIVFAEWRGYGPVVSTLPFLGLFVGVSFGTDFPLRNGGHISDDLSRRFVQWSSTLQINQST